MHTAVCNSVDKAFGPCFTAAALQAKTESFSLSSLPFLVHRMDQGTAAPP